MDAIKTLTIADAVAEKLLSKIYNGDLPWGQQLPSQRKLAKMLNVGVSSLREGLQILQAMGFIEVKRGQGTFITENPAKPFSRNITRSIYSDANVRNLMEAREVLDTGLAVLAAKKADEKDIEKMQTHLADLERSVKSGDSMVQKYDLDFHIALVESVKNPLLEKFSYALRSSLEEFIGNIEHTEKGVQLHKDVLDAIAKRDAHGARDNMITLLKHTRQIYLKHYYSKEQ
jgi:GntR family transcriptional repressor for pyruvate dehydrogenase complex